MAIQGSIDTQIDDALAAEINDYFSSIEDSFEKSLPPPHRKMNLIGKVVGTIDFIALLSVIPLVPGLIWMTIEHFAPTSSFTVLHHAIRTSSFPLWWFVCALVWVPLAIIVNSWNDKRAAKGSKERLDSAPMRFALCFCVVREIDRFTKNRLPKHAEAALHYWRLLMPALFSSFDFGIPIAFHANSDSEQDMPLVRYRRGVAPEMPSIWWAEALTSSYPWFKLAPGTARIVEGFNSLRKKIRGRVKDKKDLLLVSAVLRNLTAYLYLAIPEISSSEHRTSEDSQHLAEIHLLRFADLLSGLAPYSAEIQPLEGKAKRKFEVAACIDWFVSLFSHESPLIKFCSWWIFTQILVVILLIVASRLISTLRLDSALISLAIGTPLLVSAAALAGPLRKK